MMLRRALLVSAIALPGPIGLGAQARAGVRSAVVYETYSFQEGYFVDTFSELTIPFGVTIPLGPGQRITLSSAFARVELTSGDPTQFEDQEISGLLDAEVRLTRDIIPGRLSLIAIGAIPTGIAEVAQEDFAVLVGLTSEVLNFTAQNLGTGGSAGGGLVGAIPVGQFAIGFAGTYTASFPYIVQQNDTTKLRPGNEFRIRFGVEGAAARRTYIRAATVYARSQQDEIGGVTVNGLGNRFIGYLSVNQGFGNASATVYGFDVIRGNPQLEPTVVGTVFLPKSRLAGIGAQVAVGLRGTTTVTPLLEYRVSDADLDPVTEELERQGKAFRFGVELRQHLGSAGTLLLNLERMTGDITDISMGLASIDVSGTKIGVGLEIIP